ncbi:cytochrome P450 [Vararia minispora EC-137]|uniref:Cytochrome P450 n=1 Tax=Vararia minispora EC-137 TaxID=1314806 RepID=A0ACB8QLV3_9AGAM|nr:cytochrome P450 [Vararia minispora EC-137]
MLGISNLVFQALCAVFVSFGGYVFLTFFPNLVRSYTSPLSNLPGPARGTFLHGNFDSELREPQAVRLLEAWTAKYGRAIRYHSFFWTHKLLTVDLKAMHHILSHGNIYRKSEFVRHGLGSVLGQGLLFVEGSDHKRERKVIAQNPAFGPAQVRKFTETFIEKSLELRDIFLDIASKTVRKDGRARIDVYSWLNKITLDIIGVTGFNYNFDSLHADEKNPNELYLAITKSLSTPRTHLALFQLSVPLLQSIPTRSLRERQEALRVINRIGRQLIKEKKAAVLAETVDGTVEKEDIHEHDLLSLLIRSNIASDMPESMQMTDEEILAQVPTFLIAGHETTSTLLSWTLFALSTTPHVQTKLRSELRAYPTDRPSIDELNSLEYLDAVIREALRLYAPVSGTQRAAMEDDVIPLEEPIIDKYGRSITSIRVAKGDVVTIPIRILNRSVDVWGEDAQEFRPERWQDLPEKVQSMPGVYSNLLSFLAGPHACIGFRFSLAEAKAILFTIAREFEFELALTADEIVRKTNIVGRPHIDGQSGAQLPMLIRPVRDD